MLNIAENSRPRHKQAYLTSNEPVARDAAEMGMNNTRQLTRYREGVSINQKALTREGSDRWSIVMLVLDDLLRLFVSVPQ